MKKRVIGWFINSKFCSPRMGWVYLLGLLLAAPLIFASIQWLHRWHFFDRRQPGLFEKPRHVSRRGAFEIASIALLADQTNSLPPERRNGPKVIWTSPPPFARNVAAETELRIRFDQSMEPQALNLQWVTGGFVQAGNPHYESSRHEFVVPVRLANGGQCIVVNKYYPGCAPSTADGFVSLYHHLALPYVWRFSTPLSTPASLGSKPKLLSVSPTNGSSIPIFNRVQLTFDQPMLSADLAPLYLIEDFRFLNRT